MKKYKIIVYLYNTENKQQAQDIADEIEDKMFPDYSDSITKIEVGEDI